MVGLARKARRLQKALVYRIRSGKDRWFRTYSAGKILPDSLETFGLDLPPGSTIPEEVIRKYLEHQFNLLGSGWVRVEPGAKYVGLHGYLYNPERDPNSECDGSKKYSKQNHANIHYSNSIRKLIDAEYRPIDWHVDFKSGYRWRSDQWYRYIPKGHLRGVDIKVPWELARMQHLPQLAVAFANSESHYWQSNLLAREFRNQVLDFIAGNPPRFGVNWACAMDVAIRVSNWLIAYDMFCGAHYEFDWEFKKIFANSVYDHGAHIRNNLEGSPGRRGNHYLADLAGIAFAAQYLTGLQSSRKWRRFAVKELEREVARQFFADGSNFEASTCYHRLAAEIVVYATAALEGVPKSSDAHPKGDIFVFTDCYRNRVSSIFACLEDITKPSGNLPQIGDNDSGRFLNLDPVFCPRAGEAAPEGTVDGGIEPHALIENTLNSRASISAGYGLFKEESEGLLEVSNSQAVVSALLGDTKYERISPRESQEIQVGLPLSFEQALEQEGLSREPDRIRKFSLALNRDEKWVSARYEAFGVIYRSSKAFVLIRCLLNPRKMHSAHLHNDQLGMELSINDMDVIADPGSYLYTPLPEERDRYRSVVAHDTPWPMTEGEPARLLPAFGVKEYPAPSYVFVDNERFCGIYSARGVSVARRVLLSEKDVVIQDWGSRSDERGQEPAPPCQGYGVRLFAMR